MTQGYGKLKTQTRKMVRKRLSELVDLFEPWVRIPDNFGPGQRQRLFSPLADLLALPVTSPRAGYIMPGNTQQVPGLAGHGGRALRLTQYGRLL